MEDWPILLSFFPRNWVEMASATDSLKGLRKDKDVENYLRTLLIHVGPGYSLRETVTRAKLAGLADLSDVALLGRLRKAKDWLHSMCVALFEEKGLTFNMKCGFEARLFDATIVKEPGRTGSQWRIHYSVKVPSLSCDYLKITEAKGRGTGESFFQYSIKKGDYIVADRGYARAPGIHHVSSRSAYVTVRVNTGALPILDQDGRQFALLENISTLQAPGAISDWKVLIPGRNNAIVEGRLCAVRKSNGAIKLAHEKLYRYAQKHGHAIKPETLEYAKYVAVFTNYPEDSFSSAEVLEWYRVRWQIELVFKRFKSIAQLGHLPKYSDDSSKAWLYGKLFVALLTEKIIEYATSVSPWGYMLTEYPTPKRLA
ncbi:MAG: IS4 family transposase [Candidatus Glassbacteria bacterium]